MGFIHNVFETLSLIFQAGGVILLLTGGGYLTITILSSHVDLAYLGFVLAGVGCWLVGRCFAVLLNGKELFKVDVLVKTEKPSVADNICQYCGKATVNLVVCDNCGGNPVRR